MASEYDEKCRACGAMVHATKIDSHLEECWPRELAEARSERARLELERDEWAEKCAEMAADSVINDERARRVEGRLALADPGQYAAMLESERARCERTRAELREAKAQTTRLAALVVRQVCGLGDEPMTAREVDRLAEALRRGALLARDGKLPGDRPFVPEETAGCPKSPDGRHQWQVIDGAGAGCVYCKRRPPNFRPADETPEGELWTLAEPGEMGFPGVILPTHDGPPPDGDTDDAED